MNARGRRTQERADRRRASNTRAAIAEKIRRQERQRQKAAHRGG